MSYNGGRRIYVDADGYEHMDIDHDEPTNRITNADRIRSMTDEELAEFFQNTTFCDSCFIYKKECGTESYLCIQRWLDWLKQEADHA